MTTRLIHFVNWAGQYEPEGIYLSLPLDGQAIVLQGWGAHPGYHGRFTYNGIPLKGHPGVDIAAKPGANVLAADDGRVTEISNEPGGFGRYLKIEHRWGESLYAHLGDIVVEAGQRVERGQVVARIDMLRRRFASHLHFAIRIHPFNRFDGWGGYNDPVPYLYTTELAQPDTAAGGELSAEEGSEALPPMVEERPGMRRP